VKKNLLLGLLTTIFFSCTTGDLIEETPLDYGVPETLTVAFEQDAETRIQLQDVKTVWTKGDLVSVFYRSDANQKWQYTGETGERVGNLSRLDAGHKNHELSKVVVVYPYRESYYINPETCDVEASLPSVQNYLPDSYGLNGNILISSGYYNQFSLKSVCGWLKLQLTGDGTVVKSVTLKGNNNEQVAGRIYINSADASATLAAEMGNVDEEENGTGGNLVFDDTILTEVILDCGTEGVKLGTETTAFYIALPPQTFSNGITVDVIDSNGQIMTKSTSKEIVVSRNVIQPLASFEFQPPVVQKNTEIWYTSISKLESFYKTGYGASFVSNEWDSETGKGVITFDAPVTTIPSHAFRGDGTSGPLLTSISIPDSAVSIGDWVFGGNTNLVSVNLGKGMKTVGDVPFFNCPNLKEIMGACATDDGRAIICNGSIQAFAPAGITTYDIPSGVNAIANQVFRGASELVYVNIPTGVKSIGELAFFECTSLREIYIPDSVNSIERSAFQYCSGLDRMTIGKGLTSVGEYAFQYCSGKLFINRNIGANWFQYAGFTEVIVAEGVTTIGNNAFQYSDMSKVTLPDSITTIGESAFSGCVIGDVHLSDKITSIGKYAFNGCGLTSALKIPAGLKTIAMGAFAGNDFWSVNLSGVTSIGDYAFSGCSFMSLEIPSTVTTIGYEAFSKNKLLSSVTIPASVTSIGDRAFLDCVQLDLVRCKRTTPPTLGRYVFAVSSHQGSGSYTLKINYNCTIYVPASSLSKYSSASNWSQYYSCFVGE
jgi:hypothetical protein